MKFIVIGCGSIGRRHIGNLLRLGHEVVAWNQGSERRERVRRDFGIPVSDDLDALLDQGADAAVVCSPNSHHLTHAAAAVRAGVHLFVEKPVADRLDGLPELEAEATQRRLVTHVGCNMRFHFGPATVKSFLVEGRLGKPLWAFVWGGMHLPDWHPGEDYRHMYSAKVALGGGAVLDFIHEIDLIRWLFGDPARVAAMVGRSGWLDIETEDMADAILSYVGGMQVGLHLDYLQRPFQRGVRVVADGGWVQWDLSQGTVVWYDHYAQREEEIPYPNGWAHNDMYIAQMRHFSSRVATQDLSENGLAEGRKALELAIRIKQSSANNSFL
jgi:predicted dehydrogenase